jgi:hypothetical protein
MICHVRLPTDIQIRRHRAASTYNILGARAASQFYFPPEATDTARHEAMATMAIQIKLEEWGTLATLAENTLDKVLRMAGSNVIRCVNKNGQALAHDWMWEGRDHRAAAVEGSQNNWTAYTEISRMASQPDDTFNPTYVQGNCDAVVAMVRAAYGHNVLGCALSGGTTPIQASHRFQKAFVFVGAVVLMEAGSVTSNGDNPNVEMIRVQAFYDEGTLKNINVISRFSRSIAPRSDGRGVEKCIVEDIIGMVDVRYANMCGRDNHCIYFRTDLRNILSPTRMRCLSPEEETRLAQGMVSGDLFAAYLHCRMHLRQGFGMPTNVTYRLPDCEGMFYAQLWRGGPSFCVVNDGRQAFRTPQWPR